MAEEKVVEILLSDRSSLRFIASDSSSLVRVVLYVPGIANDGRAVMTVQGSAILSGATLRALKTMFDAGTYISF